MVYIASCSCYSADVRRKSHARMQFRQPEKLNTLVTAPYNALHVTIGDKRMTRILFVVSVIWFWSYGFEARPQQQALPGSIKGTIVRAGSRGPVSNAQVRLIRTGPLDSAITPVVPSFSDPSMVTRTAKTDGSGRFSFTN